MHGFTTTTNNNASTLETFDHLQTRERNGPVLIYTPSFLEKDDPYATKILCQITKMEFRNRETFYGKTARVHQMIVLP